MPRQSASKYTSIKLLLVESVTLTQADALGMFQSKGIKQRCHTIYYKCVLGLSKVTHHHPDHVTPRCLTVEHAVHCTLMGLPKASTLMECIKAEQLWYRRDNGHWLPCLQHSNRHSCDLKTLLLIILCVTGAMAYRSAKSSNGQTAQHLRRRVVTGGKVMIRVGLVITEFARRPTTFV